MSIKKHATLIFTSSIVQSLMNFISGVLLTRIIGAEGRGVLQKIDASIGLLSFFTTLKAPIGLVFFTANKKIAIEKLLGMAILIISMSTIACIILFQLLLVIGGIGFLLPLHYHGLFFIIYLFALFIVTQSELFSSSFLTGGKYFEKFFQNQISSSIARLIILSVAFLTTLYLGISFSLKQGLLLHLFVVFILFLISFYFYISVYKIKPSFNISYKNDIKPFGTYSIISSLSLFMNFINKSADIWIVDYYSGTIQLGLYAVAVNLSSIIGSVPSIFRELLIPYFASGDQKKNLENLTFFSRINFTLLSILLVLLLFLSNYMIPVLYGVAFQESILPFQILLFGTLLNGSSILFSAYNYGTSKPKLNLYSNLIGVLITLILDFILIPKYGITGAAIASSIAYAISAIFIFCSIIIIQKLPFHNYFFLDKNDIRTIKNYLIDRYRQNGI